jgi:hypothetical protein
MSCWELGVFAGPKKKTQEDYKGRPKSLAAYLFISLV